MISNTNHNNNIVYPNKTVSEHESGYFEDCDDQSSSMDKGNSDCSSLVRGSQNENNNNNNNVEGKGKKSSFKVSTPIEERRKKSIPLL